MLKLGLQFLKFTATGATCFAIDFGIMALLTECAGINYLISGAISFCTATAINYIISIKWVYQVRDSSAKAAEFTIFLILSAIGLALNLLVIWLFVEFAGLYYMLAKVISGVIVSFYNFTTRKFYLERGTSPDSEKNKVKNKKIKSEGNNESSNHSNR